MVAKQSIKGGLNIDRKIFIIGVLVLVVGLGAGFTAGWYHYIKAPEINHQQIAKEQQERVDSMVRAGEVIDVQPEAITIEVEKGGAEIGETVKYRTNEFSKIQVGQGYVETPGIQTDLTAWFSPGDYANLLVSDGQAVLIHRELSGEEQRQIADNS